MKGKVLVVDDELAIQKALVRFLKKLEYDAEGANDGTEAIEMAKHKVYDLVITDLTMPNMTGIELMRQLKKINAQTAYLIMTGYGTIESAIEAIKEGAFHYLTKPFELNDVGLLVDKVVRFKRLTHDNEVLQRQVKSLCSSQNMVGCSEQMKDLFRMVERVADTDSNILILGESGTGKELVAKALHYASARSPRPLVPVNCGAIPEALLESELFGHVKGAFTGAVNSKVGKFEQAQGGTIFLDEIGDMSLKLQVKLLRVLQERKLEPVGSTQSVDIDVRVIAATHRNLEELIAAGKFREDLYYRLNVIPITLSPLRDRLCDIPLLVNHFLDKFAKSHAAAKPVITEELMGIFKNYKWPGNVRELENTMERLVVLYAGQRIKRDDLPEKFTQTGPVFSAKGAAAIPDAGISLKTVVDDFENSLILKALDKTNWNKNRAATLLRLNRTTLVEKLKKRKISRRSSKSGVLDAADPSGWTLDS